MTLQTKLPSLKELKRDIQELTKSKWILMLGFLTITLITFFFNFGVINDQLIFQTIVDMKPMARFMGSSEPIGLGAWWLLRTIGLLGSLLIIPTNILWVSGKRSAFILAFPQAFGFLCQYIADGLNLNFLIQLFVIIPMLAHGLLTWTDEIIKIKKVGTWIIFLTVIGFIILSWFWLWVDILIKGDDFFIDRTLWGLGKQGPERLLDIMTNSTTMIGYILLMKRQRLTTIVFTLNDLMMFLLFTPITTIGWSSLHMNISFIFFLVTKGYDYFYWWFKLPTEDKTLWLKFI